MDLVGMTDPSVVHATLCRLSLRRAEDAFEVGRWLLAGKRLRLHVTLGYGSFPAYAQTLFDFTVREVRERVRVAEKLESLPELAEALRTGALHWSAVRELTRVANEETEAEWIAASVGRPVTQVERMVAEHEPGSRPTDPPSRQQDKRVSFRVSVETIALLEEAKSALRAEHEGSVSDDVLVEAMARAVLSCSNHGGSSAEDTGRASYQIGITVCDRCRTITQRAGGDDVVVDEATLEQARCDAQELGRVDVNEPARATRAVPSKVRRAVMHRQGKRCAVPGCGRSSWIDLHHVNRRADGGGHDPDNLIVLCAAHHKATHTGHLVIRRSYSAGFVFEHADGLAYGSRAASPARASALAAAMEALVSMGWKQREAQRFVDRAKPHVGPEPKVEDVIRAALQQAPTPTFSGVREEVARYEPVA